MAHRGSRVIALLFLYHCTRRGWGVSVTLQLLFTPLKDPVPIVQEAGWAPGPVWKISSPPGFDPRTVQPVASRYTDYATLPTYSSCAAQKNKFPYSTHRHHVEDWDNCCQHTSSLQEINTLVSFLVFIFTRTTYFLLNCHALGVCDDPVLKRKNIDL